MLKTTKQRIYATVILTIFFVALIIGAISFNGLSYNTKLHTKDIATASDLVLDNYVADEYQSQTPATSRSIIIRSEWNDWLENINTWATSITEVEDDLYVFTFDTANDAYLAKTRVYNRYDYCFETVFDVSDDLNDVDTEVFDTIVSNESDITMKPVTIAVLDTGYSGDSDKVLKGFSLIEGSSNIKDNNGHGTRLIDIIDSMTYDNVKILPVKVANKDGFATILSVYSGIKLAIEQGVDVINISLNATSSERSFLLEEAINEATSKGITVVVSAGNKSSDIANIVPANIDNALVVSAVNIHDTFEYYSNYGTTIDYATYGNYHGIGGTSIAAARMSAMVAYKLGLGEDVTVLREIAYNPTGATWDEYYGYGIVNPVNIYGNELATNAMNSVKATTETTWVGKTDYDIGPDIVHLDWKTLDTETLDKYLIETHYAFVGSLLATLSDEEMEELVAKSEVAKGTVEEIEFQYKLDVPEDDADVIGSRSVDFVTYCLEEYNYRKDELTISSDFWWYKGEGDDTTADGELWLKDKSGETCFRIYAPAKYYVDHNNKTTAKWSPQSVNSSDTSDGYMKISKVARPGNAGPVIAAAKIIQSGYQSFISFSTKSNSDTGAKEQYVEKFPMVSAEKMDTGEVAAVWQFTFSNYDVGSAPIGEHFATSKDTKVFDTHLNKEYDPNVRPYGYWSQTADYWKENPTMIPSGKIHTKSECVEADAHANDNNWQSLLGNSLEQWDVSIPQGYVYAHIDDYYTNTIQSVRYQGYYTTEVETLDSLHYWYLDGSTIYEPKTIVNSPLQTYKGETTKTKYLVQKKYPSAKFIQINHINGLACGNEERWLPLFSSDDFPGVESMMELGKCASYWVYEFAYSSDAGVKVENEESSFVNDNIAVRGLHSSYNSDTKTVQIVGGWQAFGLKCIDFDTSGEGVSMGTNATLATESDIPEIFIQTVANNLTVQYSVAISEENMKNERIEALFNTNKQQILNQCIADVVTYGEEYSGNVNFKPNISLFTPTGLKISHYSALTNEWTDYTGNGKSIEQIVAAILATPNETGGILYITRMYEPQTSTLVVKPDGAKWYHDGDGDGVKELYTGSDLYITTNIKGFGEPIEALIIEPITWTGKFLKTDNTVYKTESATSEWDRLKGWVYESGTLEGVLLGGATNGKLEAGSDVPKGGVNYLNRYPLYADNIFIGWNGVRTNETTFSTSEIFGNDNPYYTSMLMPLDNMPAGYFEIDLTTGGEPITIIDSPDHGGRVFYSGRTGNSAKSLSPWTFNQPWSIDSTIMRYYTYKADYQTLDANGCAPNADGTLVREVIRAVPLDYIYKFGEGNGSVDVITPAWDNEPLITIPNGPAHSNAAYIFKNWTCDETGEIYEVGDIVLLSDLDWDGDKVVTFTPNYDGEICTITLKGITTVNGSSVSPTNSYTTKIYAYKGTNTFYRTKSSTGLSNQITSIPTLPNYANSLFVMYEKDGMRQVDETGNIVRASLVTSNETWTARVTFSEIKEFLITLDTNGITPYNNDEYDKSIIIGTDGFFYNDQRKLTSQVIIPEALGYNFLGYYQTAYGVNASISEEPIISANGIINKTYDWFIDNNVNKLYAAWGTPFNVTLDFNHDSIVETITIPEAFEVAYGGAPEELSLFNYTPYWPGRKFLGWYDAASGGNLVYDPNTGEKRANSKYWDNLGLYKHNSDMILYAHWSPATYSVKYNPGILNGVTPSGAMSNSIHTYGTSKALNKISYNLTMDILYDLNDSENGSTRASISNDSDTINGTFKHWTGDIKAANTLEINRHAGMFKTNGDIWNKTVISVTNVPLNDNGIEDLGLISVSCSNNNATASYDKTTGEITITSVRDGICIVTVTAAETNKYAETSVNYYVYGRETLKPEAFTVTLDVNGGTCSTSSMLVIPGGKYGDLESLPTPTRSGHTFLGWSTNIVGTYMITDNTKVIDSKPHTLYAIWQKDHCTVTFNANGGVCTTTTLTVNGGSCINPMPVPTITTPVTEQYIDPVVKGVYGAKITSFEFVGWFTSTNGGTEVTETTPITCDMTLYAIWGSMNQSGMWDGTNDIIANTHNMYTNGVGYVVPDTLRDWNVGNFGIDYYKTKITDETFSVYRDFGKKVRISEVSITMASQTQSKRVSWPQVPIGYWRTYQGTTAHLYIDGVEYGSIYVEQGMYTNDVFTIKLDEIVEGRVIRIKFDDWTEAFKGGQYFYQMDLNGYSCYWNVWVAEIEVSGEDARMTVYTNNAPTAQRYIPNGKTLVDGFWGSIRAWKNTTQKTAVVTLECNLRWNDYEEYPNLVSVSIGIPTQEETTAAGGVPPTNTAANWISFQGNTSINGVVAQSITSSNVIINELELGKVQIEVPSGSYISWLNHWGARTALKITIDEYK